jgi:hypothetical protein
MKANKRFRSLPLTAIVFLVTGIFWIIASLSSESSIHTVGAGLISLAAGALMTKGFYSRYRWSFYTATSLYNFVLFAYMAYASSLLIEVGILAQGLVSLLGYLIAAIIYLIILLRAFYKPIYLESKSD